MNAKEKHVYLFSELDQAEAYAKDGWDSVRGLLGGKGANLAGHDPAWSACSSGIDRHYRILKRVFGSR